MVPVTKKRVWISLIFLIVWEIFLIYEETSLTDLFSMENIKLPSSTHNNKHKKKIEFPTIIPAKNPKKYTNHERSTHERRNYSVLAAAVPDFLNDTVYYDRENGQPIVVRRSWAYVFNLPIACAFWRRLGYHTIALITIDYRRVSRPALRLMTYVEGILKSLDVTVIYFDMPSYKKVRLSQCLRLAAGQLPFLRDDDIVVTDDVDMWPFKIDRYVIPVGKNIHVANAMCCGQFRYKDSFGEEQFYQEYPMSSIGMSSRTWRSVFGKLIDGSPNIHNVFRYKSIKPLLERIEKFANSSNIYTSKHADVGWYIDQRFASYEIEEWLKNYGHQNLAYEKRPKKWIKVLSGWFMYRRASNLGFIVDHAHMIAYYPWSERRWNDVIPLINHLFANSTFCNSTTIINFLNGYRTTFLKLKFPKG